MAYSNELATAKICKLTAQQDSIRTTASWILHHRRSCRDTIAVWHREFMKAEEGTALNLIYLANEVLQTSRRRGTDFQKEFEKYLPGCFEHAFRIASPETKARLVRVVNVWQERSVYPSAYCEGLVKLSERTSKKRSTTPTESSNEKRPRQESTTDKIRAVVAKCRDMLQKFSSEDPATSGQSYEACRKRLKCEEAMLLTAIEAQKRILAELESRAKEAKSSLVVYETLAQNVCTALGEATGSSASMAMEEAPIKEAQHPRAASAEPGADAVERFVAKPVPGALPIPLPASFGSAVDEALPLLSRLPRPIGTDVGAQEPDVSSTKLLNNILFSISGMAANGSGHAPSS